MTAIEEMAGMDVLCSDKTGTLTLNKLTVDRNLIEVGSRGTLNRCVYITCAGIYSRARDVTTKAAAIY